MFESGEDPLYIARRVTRFASEDIGLADPHALEIAVAAYQACHFIGMPECSVNLTEAVIYMSIAPKSNAMEIAYNMAKQDAINLKSDIDEVFTKLPKGRGLCWEDVPTVTPYRGKYSIKIAPCLAHEIAEIDTWEELKAIDPAYRKVGGE